MRGRDGHDGLTGAAGRDGDKGEKGDKGETGIQGPPGPISGGALYTRWGKTTCPGTPGTELVYSGLAGGSLFTYSGGGANYLCLPKTPEYLVSGNPTGYSYLYVQNMNMHFLQHMITMFHVLFVILQCVHQN